MSGYAQGPATNTTQTPEQRAAALIRQEGSVYFKAFSMQPEAFAASAAKEFDILKGQSTIKAGMSDYAYLQALVRQSGMSKGKGPLNQVDPNDLTAIKNVYQSAYLSGVDWQTWLENYAQSPYAASSAGPKFSKSVSTALQLIDKTDAETILTKAYYDAYGKMPSSKQIESFKTKYNKEAQIQMAKTTTSGTTSTSGNGSSTTSKSVTSGQGFTQAEQDQFLADFLKKNYKITGKEETGRVKTIIDSIKQAYENNLLPLPSDNELIQFAAKAIGTGDATTFKNLVDNKINSIRLTAAKFHPGTADIVAAGNDISSIADPLVKNLNTQLNLNVTRNDARVKAMLNYNDGKTVRVMNAVEQQRYMESLPEFATSDAGRQRGFNIADALESRLK